MLAAGGEVGYLAWHHRVLTSVTTLPLFLWQMLHGHTACRQQPHLSGWRCSAAADDHARVRLLWRVFDLRFKRVGTAVPSSALDDGRWQSHRSFLVENSGCLMPDTLPLQYPFGQSTEPRPGWRHSRGTLPAVVAWGYRNTSMSVCSSHTLVQAGMHAGQRVGARQTVDVPPGRRFVKSRVRRTPPVKGIPRPCGIRMDVLSALPYRACRKH
jgi:hypothetical protein